MKRLIFPGALLVIGCATEPIIDREGINEAAYQQDLAECRDYANEVNTPAETVKGGAIGAAVGTAVGAILGDRHEAGRGAGIGTVAGGGQGLTEAERRKKRILYRCMKGRGYRLLG